MNISKNDKEQLKKELIDCIKDSDHLTRATIFGSFLTSDNPHDIDLAIFDNRDIDYLSLALEYRKKLRSIAKRIPIDVIPLRLDLSHSIFKADIQNGEIIYEKRN